MSTISTHVLDTASGRPAAGVRVTLSDAGSGVPLGSGETDADGRLRTLLATDATLAPGVYRLRFEIGEYFARAGRDAFYPEVVVCFTVAPGEGHYHVPLLVSPFGYSTYRGS